MIITNQSELEDLCSGLRAAGSFGLDTEFVRERTYFVQLGIMQVAAPGLEAILDPLAIESLTLFYELIGDPNVEKVVHAGEQDFSIFYSRTGKAPARVFDTQIAAALLGYGDQLSYATLVEKVTGIRLSKLETLTDWTARPLNRSQEDYALEDVRHLPALREHLGRRLRELNRETWAREEFRYLEDAATYQPPEPRRIYERLQAGRLNPQQLGVLRELAAWREDEAMRRDLPRGWVVKDYTLVEVARRRPQTLEALRQIRSLKAQELERSGNRILAAVRRGLADPIHEERTPVVPPGLEAKTKSSVRLLEAWLYERSAQVKVAPSMLASRTELKALVAGHIRNQIPDLPVISGWRKEVVGQDLLDALAGKLQFSLDPTTGRPRAERVSNGERS